jgi:predicted metal-dependent hydrolase
MHTITYGSRTIPFSITFRDRKTIEISVLPDQSVQVIAPTGRAIAEVVLRVQRRAKWIVRQQSYFQSFIDPQPPFEYVSGETHRYLGRQYLLKVLPFADLADTSGKQECVKLRGAFLRVYTSNPRDREHTRNLLESWYRHHAKRKFAERLDECHPLVRKYGINKPMMMIRVMSYRWGSCTRAGRILLNPKLIQAPTHCIDYVILHELCHLKYADHGVAFHRLLDAVLPEWRASKERLEKVQW